MGRVSPTASLRERFEAGVVRSHGCWTWSKTHTAGGYAIVSLGNQRSGYAHRLAYELFVGPIPDGREVHHICKTKGCVNPAHLEAVTHAEHVERDKGRREVTVCQRGHDLTNPENVYEFRSGRRKCRPCAQVSNREYQRRRYWRMKGEDGAA